MDSKHGPTSGRTAILMVTPWFGGTAGGVAVATEGVVHGLRERGVPCVVVERLADGVLPRFRRGTAGERVIGLCVRPDPGRSASVRPRLAHDVRMAEAWAVCSLARMRFGLTVAHFHYPHDGYRPLFEVCRRLGLKTVVTFHGTDVNGTARDDPSWATTAELVAVADRVTAVSSALLDVVVDRIPAVAAKGIVVPNSVPTDFAAEASRADADGVEKDIDVLFIGNLRAVKGPDVLVEALHRVVRERPGVRLTVAGDGPLEEPLVRRVAELGLGGNVTFRGRVSRTEVIRLLRRARIVAIPSRSEGAPLVALEAQFLGVPVVASDVGGLRDEVAGEESGILLPPEDGQALAGAIARLLADEELRARFGDEARRRVRRAFLPERIAEQYLGVYASVLEHGAETAPPA